MSATAADTAFHVAERLHTDGPWDVFAERIRRYEIHLNGRTVELVRGPIQLEGYALRLFRSVEDHTATGAQSSTDLSETGIRAALADAQSLLPHASFPAKSVELPRPILGGPGSVEVIDRSLWAHPLEALQAHVDTLLNAFDGRADVRPSFGSVRATLGETTIANSEGLRTAYSQTLVEFEFAVQSLGGPEGPAPGEYWVNDSSRRLETQRVPGLVEEWCGYARDARGAKPPPTGDLPVVLPSSALAGILPSVIGFRLSGAARIRQIAPPLEARWGAEQLTLYDDGRRPWAIGSSPVDDEGTPQRRRTLISRGQVSELLYDVLHAAAFDTRSTGNGQRRGELGTVDWHRFLHQPHEDSTTLVVEPGDGGSDEELIEAAGEGVWVQQLGWANPDRVSGAFGGELRIGYRIRGGRRAEPLRGGTVGGVVLAPPGSPSLVAQVAAIGSQGRLSEGVDTPALLIRPLSVAGA